MRVGALGREALPGDGPVAVVEAVVAVGDEAAVGEHAVRADLDEPDAGDHDAEVEERALADAHARRRPGAVIHTPGSSSVPAPTSRRPSRSASSTLPWTGQRTNASRRANSQWIRARFQGSVLRSYQRHFCSHSLACAAVIGPENRTCSAPCRFTEHRAARRRGGRTVVGNAACLPDPCWPRWPPAPSCPPPPSPPSHTVAPGETLSGIAAANGLADERRGRRQRPVARGARRHRHQPHDPRGRAGSGAAGDPGAASPGTTQAPAASGGGGYRVAARRLAERHRGAPGHRPEHARRRQRAQARLAGSSRAPR